MKIKEVVLEANSVLGAIGQGVLGGIAPHAAAEIQKRQKRRNKHLSTDTDTTEELENRAVRIIKDWELEFKKNPPANIKTYRTKLNNYLKDQHIAPTTIPKAFKVSNPPAIFKNYNTDESGNTIIPLYLESSHRADVERYVMSMLLYARHLTVTNNVTKRQNYPDQKSSTATQNNLNKKSAMDMSKLSTSADNVQVLSYTPFPKIKFNNITFYKKDNQWIRSDTGRDVTQQSTIDMFNNITNPTSRQSLLTTPDNVDFLNFSPVEIRYKGRIYYQDSSANWKTTDPADPLRFNLPQDFFDKQLDVVYNMQQQKKQQKTQQSSASNKIINPTVTP